MTPRGPRRLGRVLAVILVGFAASLLGCASLGPVTQVTVPDVKSVTGPWKGLIYRSGISPDYATLTIHDDGTYDVVLAEPVGTSQPIGITRGHGKIAIKDGRLLFEGVNGRGVGTLLKNPGGDLVMNVDATLDDNSTLTAKLFPSR
jgi:hypothetical protein